MQTKDIVPCKTKTGETIYLPAMEFIMANQDETMGLCLACGEEAYGVEPDARCYECECCGQRAVFGLEQCALEGRVAPE